MAGWLKISRDIEHHWLYQDKEKLGWWIDLLIMANWADAKVIHDSHIIELKRGQMITSISFLCKRWGKSNKTVIRFLKLLKQEGMIVHTMVHRQTSILTICNYDKYQGCDNDPVHTIVHPQVHGIVHTIKEEKEEEYIDTKVSSSDSSESDLEESNKEGKIKEIFAFWNAMVDSAGANIKKVIYTSGTSKRKDSLSARIKTYGMDMVKEAITKAMNNPFLNGYGQRGWTMTFDWFVRPNNFPRVLEGNYYQSENQQQALFNQQQQNLKTNGYISKTDRRDLEEMERDRRTSAILQELLATNKFS